MEYYIINSLLMSPLALEPCATLEKCSAKISRRDHHERHNHVMSSLVDAAYLMYMKPPTVGLPIQDDFELYFVLRCLGLRNGFFGAFLLDMLYPCLL